MCSSIFLSAQMTPKPSTAPGERVRLCLVLYSAILHRPILAIVSPSITIDGPQLKLLVDKPSTRSGSPSREQLTLPQLGLGARLKVAVTTGMSARKGGRRSAFVGVPLCKAICTGYTSLLLVVLESQSCSGLRTALVVVHGCCSSASTS